MIIASEKLKSVSQKILTAVDSNELSVITETLELKTVDNILYMNVTNKEYYASIKLELGAVEAFHATVNANVFLKLVSQITTADIELTLENNSMVIKANGTYKLPLIFEDDHLLELPKIEINNKVKEFTVSGEILNSILTYNSKELLRGTISKPIQKLYYVDEQGAITFTSGACVNSFTLPESVRLLLNNRLVKLFKLFDESEVKFSLGYDSISDELIQTKVAFETDDIKLTAVLAGDASLIDSVPVNAIRGRANNNYTHSVVFDKNALLQMISRLLLFTSMKNTLKPYCQLDFEPTSLTVWDTDKENFESINYVGEGVNESYKASLDLVDLKAVLDSCSDQYVTFSFGDHQAFVLSRGNIKNIIPEIKQI